MRVAVVLLLITLSACSPKVQETRIPVLVPCPEPRTVARPYLPAADLVGDETPSEIVRAFVLTIDALRGYAEELEVVIEGYR